MPSAAMDLSFPSAEVGEAEGLGVPHHGIFSGRLTSFLYCVLLWAGGVSHVFYLLGRPLPTRREHNKKRRPAGPT